MSRGDLGWEQVQVAGTYEKTTSSGNLSPSFRGAMMNEKPAVGESDLKPQVGISSSYSGCGFTIFTGVCQTVSEIVYLG
jgi:hypothetical protein